MVVATHAERRWTAEEVRRLTAEQTGHWPRYELVDGRLLVTPAPRLEHDRALVWLQKALDAYLERERVGERFNSPSDLELKKGRIVQPDCFVVPLDHAERARQWPDVKRLLLAVEILSPRTAHTDRGEKRELYQEVGVTEYWIVDLHQRQVERWRPTDDQPELLREQLVWHPPGADHPLVLELKDLFAAARMMPYSDEEEERGG